MKKILMTLTNGLVEPAHARQNERARLVLA